MRFNICCCGFFYNENEMIEANTKRRGTFIDIQTGPPLSKQPARSEPIQMGIVAQTSKQPPDKSASGAGQVPRRRESLFTTVSTIPLTEFTSSASNQQFVSMIPSLSATSNFNYIANDGTITTMAFDQIRPNFGSGTYKGAKFTIADGEIQVGVNVYTEQEKRRILRNYSQTLEAMQQGIFAVETKLLNGLQKLPPLDPRQLEKLTIPDGSYLNVNFTAESGKNFQMMVTQIKPGHFRVSFDGETFTIANGQILTLNGTTHGLNKELILSSFYRAILGLQHTKLGLQKDERAVESRLSQSQLNPMELLRAACPEKRAIFEEESLKLHNELRKLHGVPPLVHSEFLSELARQWAEHLALKDSSYQRQNNTFGENLYYSHGEAIDARKVVTSWYDEVNLYDFKEPELSKETGHFTQLVWKDTREMGTGIAQLGDKIWICCYYHPRGNIEARLDEEVLPPIEEPMT